MNTVSFKEPEPESEKKDVGKKVEPKHNLVHD